MNADQLRDEARAATHSGHLLLAVSCLFLVAVGWWGAEQRWGHALIAAAVAIGLAHSAAGELRHARLTDRQADDWEVQR